MSLNQRDSREAFEFGTSVYGGRPTFGLTRRIIDGEPTVTLYELLPTEQAEARQKREERRGRSTRAEPVTEVFEAADDGEWTWDEWKSVKVAQLRGSRLNAVLSVIDDGLQDVEANATAVTGTGEGEVLVSEQAGIRLALAFAGVKPIQRMDRMRALARGVKQMSIEECYYWYAQCQSPSSPNGTKALRVLLTNHIE